MNDAVTREEQYYRAMLGEGTAPTPITRKEKWLNRIAEALENGTVGGGASGGGTSGASKMFKIAEFTLEEDLTTDTWFTVSEDENGKALDLSELMFVIHPLTNSTSALQLLAQASTKGNNINYICLDNILLNNQIGLLYCEFIDMNGEISAIRGTTISNSNHFGATATVKMKTNKANNEPIQFSALNGIIFKLPPGVLKGTKYMIYGVNRV